ncbi:MAG: replication initiation and membrane attachment family protein [Bacilli bacterium]|jgi:replication initiation and membrane attachment protein
MTKISILPADTYIVINRSILNDNDRKVLTMLYQPIIGANAISLYFVLWSDLDTREVMGLEYTHHHLISKMKVRLNEIVEAREQLEAIGLLKTYLKKGNVNTYVYELYSPVSASEFLNNPSLSVVLYGNIGKVEYDKLIHYFTIPKIKLTDYEDITASFSDVFVSVPATGHDYIEDIVKRNKLDLKMKSKIDFDQLIESIPKDMKNDRTFNDDVINLINQLSFIYDIDTMVMQSLVRNTLTERCTIDKESLRKECRNYYQFEEGGNLPTIVFRSQPEYLRSPIGDTSKRAKMAYNFETTTPYDFLKSKYDNAEPTRRDLRLIESLIIDQELKPGVVNVLIDYVLKINNNKLTRGLVETIAGHWRRLGIETVEEAMNIVQKEHKKYRNKVDKPVKVTSKENVPEWFDKEIEIKEPSAEEKAELESILRKFSE